MLKMVEGPAGTFIEEIFRLEMFVEVTLAGFGYSTVAEAVTDTIRSVVTKHQGALHPLADDIVYQQRKERERKLAEFAHTEKEDRYPYLFGLAVVRLYSIIEGAVDSAFVAALKERPESLNSETIARIKGPLTPFLLATEEERAEIIRERLLQETSLGQKVGAGRFEAVLTSVGLDGPLPDTVRRCMLELSEIRHLIIHRNGFADRKFLERCSWLSRGLGEAVHVSPLEFELYSQTATWYLLDIGQRWWYGRDKEKSMADEVWATKEDLLRNLEQMYASLRAGGEGTPAEIDASSC